MQIQPELTDETITKEIGMRLRQIRINQNLTHKELEDKAGVSIRTISRIEKGETPHFSSFLRICRALKILEGLENFIPPPEPSPLLLAKLQPKIRHRSKKPKLQKIRKSGVCQIFQTD
jgi:putative transcriptional regulator